jgi:hypothetical protein
VALALTKAGHVEALVHSVDEKDVGVALLPEQRPRTTGQTDPGVAREVAAPAVRFRFHDARDAQAFWELVNDVTPEKCPCDDEGVASVPRAR